jgi:hypothetical protein
MNFPGSRPRGSADTSTHATMRFSVSLAAAAIVGACSTSQTITAVQEPIVAQAMPATVRADQITGRWGVASYQDPKDQIRTEAAARFQCKLPYMIAAGAAGGVVMHLADEARPQKLVLKGGPGGKNYMGPPGPAGGEKDREIISVSSSILVTRFVDPDAAVRYGNMVYARCV